jgi:hypothetical protein
VEQIIAAGHWKDGDPQIWIVGDTGYDGPRLAFLLADLPVALLVRVRSDRVMHFPASPRVPGTVGRRARHGDEFTFKDSRTWPEPAHTTTTQTGRYGTAVARSWNQLHPRLTHRGVWAEHDGALPILGGTVIRLQVDRLPGDGEPKPLWLWFSGIGTAAADVNRLWQMFLHRFALENLPIPQANPWWGETPPAHTGGGQLRLARHLVEDLRRPWEKTPTTPDRLTPARVRRGFRNIRPTTALPRRRTETLTARSRPPSRITKHPARRTTQPRQNS